MIAAENRPTESLATKWKNLRLIAHADWSKNPAKCWVVVALINPSGTVCFHTLRKVEDSRSLLLDLETLMGKNGCGLIGFDYPIGLPGAYAERAEIDDFLLNLSHFGTGEWADFYRPATRMDEISLHRPFYPQTPGRAKREHLTSALGIQWKDLYRHCEMGHDQRRSACPLFWTLGGQQVGKAAIHGWQEVLTPALNASSKRLSIWPFSGELEALLHPGTFVAVETYPAEFYQPLGIAFSKHKPGLKSGKRQQTDRRANAPALLAWCEKLAIEMPKDVEAQVIDGFGSNASGEDTFDAFVGLVGYD